MFGDEEEKKEPEPGPHMDRSGQGRRANRGVYCEGEGRDDDGYRV